MFQAKIQEQKDLLHASFQAKEEMKKEEMIKIREDKQNMNESIGKEMEDVDEECEMKDSVRADKKCCSNRESLRGSERSDSKDRSYLNNVDETKNSSSRTNLGLKTGAYTMIFYLMQQ